MHNGKQVPLAIDFLPPSECKPVHSERRCDVAEDRLDGSQTPAVDVPALWAVDLVLHAFGRAVVERCGGFAGEEVDLAWAFLLGILQALGA